jgi:hypothetical protein
MLRKLLFITSFFIVGFLSAQSFELLDHNDVDITGTNHYEIDAPANLAETKFHVKNLTNSQVSFGLKVELIYSPYSNCDLACCFGVACHSASSTISGTQIINSGIGDDVAANATYTDLKISPVTWMWNDCPNDSAVWVVTVYDPANPSDEASATIVWKCENTATSVLEIGKENVKLNAFPNPAANNLTVRYAIDGSFTTANVELFDVLGQKLMSNQLTSNSGNVKLDVSPLNAGVYFYSIRVDGQVVKTERVIIQ